MSNNEEWKPINGFEGLYEVSNKGRIKSLPRHGTLGRIITARVPSHGYDRVRLRINKKERRFLVHRLVAEAFIENKDCKPYVNHIDGNKMNNNVENLEWVTQKENIKHAWETGLSKSNENQRNAAKRNVLLAIESIKKPVLCIGVGAFDSAKAASVALGINYSNITEVAKGKRKSAGGYKFLYI